MSKYYGVALCCGKVPLYGNHNFHVWEERVYYDSKPMKTVLHENLAGFGFYCPICKKASSILGLPSVEFAMQCWNSKFWRYIDHDTLPIIPPSNVPEGFMYAMLEVTINVMGGKQGFSKNAILFKTSKPFEQITHSELGYTCGVDKWRCMTDLTLMTIDGEVIEVDWLSKNKGHSIYLGFQYCTDGSHMPLLYMQTHNIAASKRMQKLMEQLKLA